MARIKRGVTTRAKHKRILDNAKGCTAVARTRSASRQAVEKAGQYAYRDRKVKKRSFRALWIQRINAAVRAEGLTYGQFIHALKLANIDLDRKVWPTLRCTKPQRSARSSPRPRPRCPKRRKLLSSRKWGSAYRDNEGQIGPFCQASPGSSFGRRGHLIDRSKRQRPAHPIRCGSKAP